MMKLWNFIHNDLSSLAGVELHFWEVLAFFLAVAVVIIGIAASVTGKKREKQYEQALDEMADSWNPWEMAEREETGTEIGDSDGGGKQR